MHEFSIASALIDQIQGLVREHGFSRVERLEVEVGVQKLVVLDSLELAFHALAKDTPAEGAELLLREVALEAKCRACGTVFSPRIDWYQCTKCAEADLELLAGHDIILKTITGAAPEPTETQHED